MVRILFVKIPSKYPGAVRRRGFRVFVDSVAFPRWSVCRVSASSYRFFHGYNGVALRVVCRIRHCNTRGWSGDGGDEGWWCWWSSSGSTMCLVVRQSFMYCTNDVSMYTSVCFLGQRRMRVEYIVRCRFPVSKRAKRAFPTRGCSWIFEHFYSEIST